MFEKQVEERLALLKADVEEKVALGVGKLGSMKEPGSRERELQSSATASSGGRWFLKKARAFSGTEKVALSSLSWGWWRLSSGMGGSALGCVTPRLVRAAASGRSGCAEGV